MNPGAGDSSLAQLPPTSCLFSKMPTFMPPYLWRYMPATRPLFPPPTITTSKLLSAIVSSFYYFWLDIGKSDRLSRKRHFTIHLLDDDMLKPFCISFGIMQNGLSISSSRRWMVICLSHSALASG